MDDTPDVPPPGSEGPSDPEPVAVEVDLLRGDLYRRLDELTRAAPPDRQALVQAFEGAWLRFLAELGRPH